MENETILIIVTMLVTWILGIISKKISFISNNIIPIQNIAVGIIVAVIQYIITKDFSVAIALSGILAGGTYDIFNGIKKIINKEEENYDS